MLIVLLVLLTATALATAALQGTQYELRSAGYNRTAVQMEYVSEAAAINTFAWIDAISPIGQLTRQLSTPVPDVTVFGEPEVPKTNTANANRTTWDQQKSWSTVVLPPITNADPRGNVLNERPDELGTFGPRSTYIAGLETRDPTTGTLQTVKTNYAVDFYDCRQLPPSASAGNQVNQTGSGTLKQVQYYCVVTSRGRSYLPSWTDPSSPNEGTKAPTKKWTIAAGKILETSRFTLSHDARGTIITPPVSLQ